METKCVKCGREIHPMRLKALPNTKVCVECSSTGTYRGITTINGKGDHTWNDIQIVSEEQYKKHRILNEKFVLNKKGQAEFLDFEKEDKIIPDFDLEGE